MANISKGIEELFEKEAEEYLIRNLCKTCLTICENNCPHAESEKRAYKDGAEFGYWKGKDEAKQWHNLQKSPDDLPSMLDAEKKISHSVWIHIKNWGTDRGYYDYGRKVWVVGGYYDPSRHIWLVKNIELSLPDVLAWHEMPKYTEE